MLRACVAIERAGIPTVAIVSSEFVAMGAIIAKAFGIEAIPFAIYPGVILNDPEATFERKVDHEVIPALFEGLIASSDGQAQDFEVEEVPAPRETVLRGSYDEVLDGFSALHWTDGLPIVPPTTARVDAFLDYTDRDPHEVLGVLLPANREATVWNVAVNGVMAGCRPEYLPILIAIVEAIADRVFRIEDAGATPGWEPLISISGPLVDLLGFNTVAGALRVGPRANTSVGRFLRLYMRNVAGLRPQPDETDKGAIAGTFNVALAENEAAVQALGWDPHRIDRGFYLDDTVVTVRSVVTISAPIYSAGDHAEDHLETIAALMGDAIGPWAFQSYIYEHQHPLLVLGPGIAETIASEGWSKKDIQGYLFDNVVLDGAWLAKYAPTVSGKRFDWTELAAKGKAPEEYADAATDGTQVRAFVRPDWTDIVVAGNPGRNQSRAYISNHGQGVPVSRKVELPADYSARLRGAGR